MAEELTPQGQNGETSSLPPTQALRKFHQITPAITDPEHLHMSLKHANSILTSPRDRQPIPIYKSLTLQTEVTPFKSSIYTTRGTKQEATRIPSKDTSKNTSCRQTPSSLATSMLTTHGGNLTSNLSIRPMNC